MKKGLTLFLCFAVITSALSVDALAETSVVYTTTIQEDGTILTETLYPSGNKVSEFYTPELADMYVRYDYTDGYILKVNCADSLAFEKEFETWLSSEYKIRALDDGSYAVAGADSPDSFYAAGSQISYEEAEAMADVFMEVSSVDSVEIQRGYGVRSSGEMGIYYDFYVRSESELTMEGLDWASDMGYTIKSIDGYVVETSYAYAADQHWYGIYNFMLNCMTMPDVYAVSAYRVEIANPLVRSYETVKVYEKSLVGDVDQDGSVAIDDATAVLTYYAQNAAGLPAVLMDTSFMDVNADGTVDTSDATMILTIYAENAAGME